MLKLPQTPLVAIVPLKVIVKEVPAVLALIKLPPISVAKVLLQVTPNLVPRESSG